MAEDSSCGAGDSSKQTLIGLRVASIFILLVSSTSGALFPILSRRSKFFRLPDAAFLAAKYFGSGVIIATGFIHLLAPAIDELSSPCLSGVWTEYPWAIAISMMGVFSIFYVELIAFRWGTSRLKALGIGHDPHGHGVAGAAHAAHGPEPEQQQVHDAGDDVPSDSSSGLEDVEKNVDTNKHDHVHHHGHVNQDHVAAQIIGVGILEFGVVLHSVLIGLTLAVDSQFKTLFVVIIFHQIFEGIGLGSRLALLKLPTRFRALPIIGAIIYGITTPIGISIGLGIRSTYNPDSAIANIVSGIMDAISSGILLYTGLVELLAHEFLFNPMMHRASTKHITLASLCVLTGAAIMALLGRWA